MALVEMLDLWKVYQPLHSRPSQGGVEALRGVSVTIGSGEYTAIMGPSGSGKSTLVHLMGLLDTPTSGRYFLDGMDVTELDELQLAWLRNHRIGFVFQSHYLLPRYTTLRNTELSLLYRRLSARERQRRAAAALEAVGLSHRSHHLPPELSGGEQQLAAIARALSQDPDIILADEPTGNLDSVAGDRVLSCFDGLNKAGRTIVLVTHAQHVADHCRRVLHMRDGCLTEDSGC